MPPTPGPLLSGGRCRGVSANEEGAGTGVELEGEIVPLSRCSCTWAPRGLHVQSPGPPGLPQGFRTPASWEPSGQVSAECVPSGPSRSVLSSPQSFFSPPTKAPGAEKPCPPLLVLADDTPGAPTPAAIAHHGSFLSRGCHPGRWGSSCSPLHAGSVEARRRGLCYCPQDC